MIDLPSSTSDNQPEFCKFVDPPIVYQRKGSTTQSAVPHIPSHNRFADPPLVYTRKNSETSITHITQPPATPSTIDMVPSSSSALMPTL